VKLSEGVEWGLHCVVLLARMPREAAARRVELAEYHGLPESYLAKHLHALTRATVLHAVSGPKGGYRLGRAPRDITVLDVVEAIEGSSQPFVCQEIRQRGTGALAPDQCRRPCLINSVMGQADRAWRDTLRAVTIADLVSQLPASIPNPVSPADSARRTTSEPGQNQ
jgi:Rrf2 family protein